MQRFILPPAGSNVENLIGVRVSIESCIQKEVSPPNVLCDLTSCMRLSIWALWPLTCDLRLEMDDGTDTLAFLHHGEGVIDFFNRHIKSDKVIEVDSARHVFIDVSW